ncbi:MAG: polymorphic toxin-type HINT domain-containing protein [Ruminococcus sp.]|nr:polymorphic toxin-type HINT domain-containing protein [Ruminococcus sp.]
MLSLKFKKKVNQIIAGTVAAAMTMTMIPDVWLPVHAEIVRNEIMNEELSYSDVEIQAQADERWDELSSLDPNSDEYALLKEKLAMEMGGSQRNNYALRRASLQNNLLSNEYIAIHAATNGRFTIGTTGGDPNKASDDNKGLIYGHPGGGTSFTSIRVNGSTYIYNTSNSTFYVEDGYNVSTGNFGGIDVEQKLSLINNPATGRDDIAEIKYTVTNNTGETQNTGLRIMMDTMLGSNDAAPFRVPQYGSITTETEFIGDDVPQFWQAFDNLTNPSVIAQGRFYGLDGEKPDKVQFVSWRRITNVGWGYEVIPGYSNGDSAVSVVWEEKAIAPGEIREYTTYYGLSEFSEDNSLPLALSVYSDSTVSAVNGKYMPNPIDVTAYIENISSLTAEDVAVELVLPDGLSLSDGNNIQYIGEMPVKQLKQVGWKVNIAPSSVDKTYTYQVILTAADRYTKTVSRNIYVPALKSNEKLYEYAVFSANSNEDMTLNGWKANFVGGIYSGRNFICNLSEFYLDGKADTVGTVTANGWQISIPERNENIEAIAMPDLEEAILAKAGEYEYHAESPAYVQDTNIINGSVMVSGDVIISGTNFEGDCYIIADRDITYNVNNLNTTGRLVLYSRNGNITVNGTNININGIMYAPKGKVSFNANETNINGRVWADTVNFSGSIFNVRGSESDLDLIGNVSKKGIGKTYTADADFNEGSFNGLSLAVPDQLMLSENTMGEKLPSEKVYGDTQSGSGVKITCSADTSTVSGDGETVNVSYDLGGFGEIQSNENAIDLIILVDESGSMSGSRMVNAKAAAKEVISKMKSNDRCAVIGFTHTGNIFQTLTSDRDMLNKAVDKLRAYGNNNIANGLNSAIDQFDDDNRQKYIMLISDGEDSSASAAAALTAKEKGIRILAMMIGTGSLQMQTVAINSNGIYKNAPTAEDIGKIMSSFASEVFSTAGRNATFKTTVKDKNSVDLNAVTPAPSAVTENANGSVTLEWSFDRITVDDNEKISIPVNAADASTGFADLLTDSSCVYYDRNGKPHIIYAEDTSLPVSKYVSGGQWSAVYDSKKSGTEWKSIYWNGRRYGDSKITVTACASEDGVTFGEAVPVENYGEMIGLSGRYVKLCVNMTLSSDGRSPELYDITVMSEETERAENSQPSAEIFTKHNAKVNVPVNVRGIVSDDCLAKDLTFEWSCNDGNVTFADKNALNTSAVFSAEGEYTVRLTVNDGEKTAEDVFDITVSPADTYADIDPESGEAAAPKISANIPRYADRYQKITVKIENLNNTEIAWYSVIMNGRQTIEVSDEGEFTFTCPGSYGDSKIVIRAFDWAGQSDVKEYTITVSNEEPTVEIIPSADSVNAGDEAYFTVNTTVSDKIKSIEYSLNGESVTVSGGKYTLDTAEAGEYTLSASAVTSSGKNLTASAVITVKKQSVPVVDLMFDKDSYAAGDNVTVTVIAEDENGIGGVALEYDGKQVTLDENNSYTIEGITAGVHTLVGIAWNTDGVVSSTGYEIEILTGSAVGDDIPPELTVSCDRFEIFAGETLPIYIEASDNSGEVFVTVTVNGESVPYDGSGVFEFRGEAYGIYEIMVYAGDAAGNKRWDGVNIAVNVRDQDISAPVVEIALDKEIYYENDDIVITVKAEDNVGVDRITVTVNEEEVSLDENGKYVIENAATGTYTVKATAYDKVGNSAWTSLDIPVNEKTVSYDRLTLDISADEDSVEIGKPFDILIAANGGMGEKTLSCTVNNESIPVRNSKAVYTPDKAGEYVISVSAVDEAGNSVIRTLTLTITESGVQTGGGSEETIVSAMLIVNGDRLNDGDHNEASVGDEVSVAVEITGLPDSEIESLDVTVNGREITLDSDKKAVYIPEKAGEYLFNAVIKAKDGNSLDLKYMLYVTENSGSDDDDDDIDESVLLVEIASPEDVKEITAPTDIIGSAKGSGLVKYTLEYAPADTGDFVKIFEKTSCVDNDILGQIDPTMLRNGYYDIRLTGYTDKAHKSDTVTVYVTGQMKIGNFSVAFQDMDVNVPGLALTVVRGYDSRDRAVSGDFGYGWNLSLTGADISESGKPSENWSQNQSGGMVSQFRFSEDKAHEVSIDWGNGKTDKFRMSLSPISSLTPITAGITVEYKAQRGTTSALEAINKSSTALIYNSGLLMYSDFTPYQPDGYKLTKRDGTVYYFDSEGNVNRIADTNGNTIEITHDGIIHSGGKSIVFDRDGSDRITSITSPTGKRVEYTYDANGDLVSVKDVSGNYTKFEYDGHYITNIIAPNGVSVSRNIYDDNGRLIKTVDSDGNEIIYDHDIDGRQEMITDRNGNVTLYIYDDKGNILSQTDPNGNTVKNSYDENGNLDKTIDALGNVTDYGYSAGGDLLSLTDAEGHTVTNSYNSKGQLTGINAMGINTIRVQYDDKGNTLATTDALGNDIDYAYDGKGQLTSVTDEIGAYMNMTYDGEGNVISATNGAGTVSQFTYDADGNCTSKTLTYTSDEGIKTVTEQYFYDAAGNLIKIVDSEGSVTTTEYNSLGKVSSAVDEKGRRTSYEYDDFGNMTKISYPDGTTESFTYDREGNNLTATDRMGRTVSMTYDKVGNLTAKTYPNGAKVTYAYDKNYNLISETSASGGVTAYEYDRIGRNTAITDALGNRTEFFYNAKSQLESMTDPMGRTYTYSYDDNGNRIKTTYPDGTSMSTEYDSRGRITKQTDQHGYNTRYTLDGGDNLIGVTNAQGVTTSYTYDEVGNMTSVTDGNGNVTKYSYDEFGRVVKTTNALGNCAYTTYDESGNVLTTTDYAGNLTTYTYDNLDRLIGKSNADGTVNYAYTTDGKISSVTDNSGTTMFTYDNMDGLTRVDYPDGTFVSYDYDNACRLTKVTTPFGSTSYEYDLLDRLVRVVDRNGYATVYEYDANGNRTAVHYANGYTTTYDYDLLNRLIRQETVDSDSNVVVKYVYTLGAAGERKSVTESGVSERTVEYTYDSLYRLTSETITEGEKVTTYTYAYDNVSNRILKTENGDETVYTYNALNQLLTENDIVYEYDLNGNTVRMTSPTKSALYVYNADNRLIRATVQSGNNVSAEEYRYDYAGNRVSKSSESDYTKYLLDVSGSLTYVLAEIDYDGTEKCFYTRGTDLVSQERDGKKSYYVYDGHGSVRALVNEGGKVTDRYVYDAFGNLISSYGNTQNDFLFAGEQFDPVTGLYYLRARYMNPSVGTFISMDSYDGSIDDPVSLHKYLYANANPVSNSDPSGYMTMADMEASTGIQAALNKIITPNVKALMNLFDGLSAIWDIADTARNAWNDGLRGADLAISIACGVMTSILTNFSCQILALGPIGVALFAVGALILGVGIGMALAEGDGSLALSRVAQLVGVLFAAFSPSCFTGDTQVYTDSGLVCLEEVAVGDTVWSYNYETGETELKEVLNVWIKETDEILHLSTSGGETIDTTTNHPFYVDGKGWVAAGDLKIGDTLVTADGDEVEVADVEIEKLDEPVLVYNLDVADFDTYFVGEYEVLVHNYDKPNIGKKADYAFGNATGSKHNIERSKSMEAILNKIGIYDDINGRSYIIEKFNEAFSLISEGELLENGRVKVSSLLSGKYGFALLETIWDGDDLITLFIKG